MQPAVGTVVKLVGMAMVIDEQGQRHLLKQGDQLHAGERLVTAPGALVQMQTGQGDLVSFEEKQTIKISEQLTEATEADVSESAVNRAVFEQILQALNQGADISELFDDPAAGGVQGEGNVSFVNLDRIATAVGASSLLDGGSGLGGLATEKSLENYLYFPLGTTGGSINPPPPTTPPTIIRNTLESPIISSDIWVQVGGVINKVDDSVSVVNNNVLAGLLTEAVTLTDNSTSVVNANVVSGILSGPTTVTDNSLSVVNAGVVAGVLSGTTSVTDNSTSLLNTDVVAGLFSGDTAMVDNSNSLLNAGAVVGVVSGNTSLKDNSSSLVNANSLAAVLSENTVLNDESVSLVNANLVPSILSGNANVTDVSTSLVNANVLPVLGSGDTEITNSAISPLVDVNIVPAILSGETTMTDNSSSLVNVNVVGGVLGGPVALNNDSASFIDLGLMTELLSPENNEDDLSGLLDNTVLNFDVGQIVNVDLSPDLEQPSLNIETALDEFFSGDTQALDDALSAISFGLDQTVMALGGQGQPVSGLLEETLLENQAVPDVVGYLSDPDVVISDVMALANDVLTLNINDILDIDNTNSPAPAGSGLLNQTSVVTDSLSLITQPLVLNTLLIQNNLLND